MLVTKEQGIACRKAAEYLVSDSWWRNAPLIMGKHTTDALLAIGLPPGDYHFTDDGEGILLTLLWCAEIAGEA